jgi:hypothetical protein
MNKQYSLGNVEQLFEKYYAKSLKGKGKVDTVPFLTEHHTMKAYWGADV